MIIYDTGIVNAKVLNGTGNRYYCGDVGIVNGKIVETGKIKQSQCREVIHAKGKFLAPGFVDIHSHSDIFVFHDPTMKLKLAQGITTEVSGNCGMSAAPVSLKYFEEKKQYFQGINIGIAPPENWSSFTTFQKYLEAVKKIQPATNMAFLLGHGDIRIAVMGFENRRATSGEMTEMKGVVEEAMRAGAVGISSGLIYAPGIYAETSELIELCSVVAKHGGIYTSHIRDELSGVVKSVKEAIEVGKQADIPVVISHHKIGGKENWGKSTETIKLIEEANKQGIEVSMDVYPYDASCTYLSINIPSTYHGAGTGEMLKRLKNDETWKKILTEMLAGDDGHSCVAEKIGFENVLIIAAGKTVEIIGETLSSIAVNRNEDPLESLRWLLIENDGNVMAANFAFDEKDIVGIMKHPYSMIASDGLQAGGGSKTHPRTTATFTRFLSKYVREKGLFTWEEAIRKITSLPAQIAGLKEKGYILEGFDADLVLFDPGKIKDQATFMDPYAENEGIEMVMVNGNIALEGGQFNPQRYGKVVKARSGELK